MNNLYTLDQICKKITDGSHQSPKEDPTGYPMVSVKDMTEFGFDLSKAKHISKNDFEKLVKQGCKPEVDDILIAKDGSVMKHIFRVRNADNIVLLSSIAILRPNKEIVYPDFLVYSLKNNRVKEDILNNYVSGSGVPRIVLKDFKKVELDIPNLDLQINISKKLRSLDDKIELNTQINQTLEQIAQALFKSWFVDFDPVRAKVQALSDGMSLEQAELAAMQAISGKTPEELTALLQTQPDRYAELAETAKAFPCEMVEVDGVEVPKGWELKPFGSLLENTIGGDWGKEEEDEKHTENVFVFRGTDLPNVQTNEFDAIPKRYIAKNKLKSRKAKYGDIIIEVSGGSKNQPTGRSLLITKNLLCNFNLPIIPASFCRLFTPINEKIAVLLACHLKMIYTQGKTWEYQVQSTGISNFQTKNFLENELVVIPDENIFNAFYEKVGVIFEKMTSNENMLLSKTRDLLLPRLLNGKI